MNRIEKTFAELKKAGRKGLVGYLTAGDPDMKQSEANIRVALANGLDVLELGIPFSDPTADGPEIQAASLRALAKGMNIKKALGMVSRLRRDFDTPIVLFGYANPFFRYGYKKLCVDAAKAGVDGFLVVDLPFEESDELHTHMKKHNLCFISLIAPTTEGARAKTILTGAKGFVYYIMVTGVTGARTRLASDVATRVKALKKHTKLPIAVGFGISGGKQAQLAARSADAVVAGSALVRAAKEGRLRKLVRELRAGLDRA
jgi:tryptophan synthase alpha chain